MLYFAYGSNMSREPMHQRCPDAENLGPAVLHRHRFVIMANGFASVVPDAEGIVHGVLWRVSPSDLVELDVYEDVEGGLYRREMLPVMQDGQSVSAIVYIGMEKREGAPGRGYMELVVHAARENVLPEDYIETLSRMIPRDEK